MSDYLITFSGKENDGKAKKDKFLALGKAEQKLDIGFVVPDNGVMQVITTNQENADSSTLDLYINGVVIDTVAVTSENHIFPVNHPVLAGDLISVENPAAGNDLKRFTFNMLFGPAVLVPAPLTVQDTYRIQMTAAIYSGLISAHGSKTVLKAGNTARETENRIDQIYEIVDAMLARRP